MTTPFAKSTLSKLAGGALLLAAALALTACETTGTGAPGPVAQAAPAAPVNPMAGDKSSEPKGPMTHQQAALYCWMKTEHGRADQSLDKRADVVDKCIAEKMQGN